MPRAFLGDAIGVWGRGAASRRGRLAVRILGRQLTTLEDGFLRSVLPGRDEPSVSLIADDLGIYFDATRPSRLDQLVADSDGAGAMPAMMALRERRLSKYNHAPDLAEPPVGHVLVIDQTRGDASIRFGGADEADFARMLAAARVDHPNADIIIKTHPETASGAKQGYFGQANEDDRTQLISSPANPWDLLEGAAAVYTVTSQMGMEGLIAGRSVRCFGMPFYAGWGATEDEVPAPPHRGTPRDVSALFRAAYLDYPIYMDPWRFRQTDFYGALDALTTLRLAHQQTQHPAVAVGMRLWKRSYVKGFLGPNTLFQDDIAKATKIAKARDARVVKWGRADSAGSIQMEDGFLRSPGLGATLTPPLSLVLDDEGIYFDPSRPSRLERLIAAAPTDTAALERAEALRQSIVALGLTKYNLTPAQKVHVPPSGKRVILVPGQVEDDASIQFGAGDICTNAELLAAVRAAAPEAWIIYKPHPDVEAGLRVGAIDAVEADHVADNEPAAALLDSVAEVFTMTSTMGFEALLRGKKVTCFGAPFYAGWGLTTDMGEVPHRRTARPNLAQLVHACLIDYPLYRDPVSGLRCPPEVIVERLASENLGNGVGNRALSKLQGLFASYAGLWR
ncbi:MAG: capsular polysaccharide biosynthesis protein [Pikeienuella sp.]